MHNFLKGMDISSLPSYWDRNNCFYNEQGESVSAFALLEEYGINSVRLRIWNDPQCVPEAQGYCDLTHTLAMAREIKAHGMHFFLDFHYSDYWADPGQQNKPAAWKDYDFDQLQKAVYDYTREVLLALADAGCLPDMVQIGNEIRSGMLFPDGAVPHYDHLAALLNAGIAACREVSSDIRVMIHLDQGGRFYYLKEWFDAVFAAGLAPIDAIGISFYSFWHGTFMDLKSSMEQLIANYHLPVYVVETAHPWRICPTGHVSEDLMKTAGLPAGIPEQKRSLELVLQITDSVSEAAEKRDHTTYDTGVYYWEPLGLPGPNYGSWDENMSMMSLEHKPLPSFAAYRDFVPGQETIPDLDAYMESLYQVDESTLPPAGTNLIANGDFADKTEGFWTICEPEDVEVVAKDGEVYVSSKENFVYQLFRDVHIDVAGTYHLSVEYRGTNTTGVSVQLFLKVITCNGETCYTKDIYPSDVAFVTHELDNLQLPAGTIQVGIRMEAPPVFGRIRNLRLVKKSEEF